MNQKYVIIGIIVILIVLIGGYYYSTRSPRKTTDPLLKKIKEGGKIVVGMEASYPPMENIDEKGQFIGMDVDIAKEIAKELRVEPEFKNVPWENIFDSVQNGEVDMAISAITITLKRAEKMDFSDPYFNAGQVVVITEDNKEEIREVQDLKHKKIGVQEKTTSAEEARERFSTSSTVTYRNYNVAKKELLERKIDAVIIDYPAAVGLVEEEELIIAGEPFTQEFYGVAVQEGQEELLSRINNTIRRLKRKGKLKELEEKWLKK